MRNVMREMVGDFVCGHYLQTVRSDANDRFLERLRGDAKLDRDPFLVSDTMEASYVGVHLWAKAVTLAGTADDLPAVRGASGKSRSRARADRCGWIRRPSIPGNMPALAASDRTAPSNKSGPHPRPSPQCTIPQHGRAPSGRSCSRTFEFAGTSTGPTWRVDRRVHDER